MKPKLGLTLVLSGMLLSCSNTIPKNENELTWPDRETQGPAWPRPAEGAKVLEDRFSHASTQALGDKNDIAAIDKVIVADRPRGNLHVEELRWLSPNLVMARVRTMEAGYYYVVKKENGRWMVLFYYLKWIS